MVVIRQDGEDGREFIRKGIEGSPYDMRKAGTDRRAGLRRKEDVIILHHRVLAVLSILAAVSFGLGYLLGGGYLNGLR